MVVSSIFQHTGDVGFEWIPTTNCNYHKIDQSQGCQKRGATINTFKLDEQPNRRMSQKY